MKIAERTVLVLTVVNLGLLAGSPGAPRLFAEPAVEPALRTRLIELVDATGQVRSRLSLAPDGEVVFRMMDQTGAIRVKLGAERDGSGLLLANDATESGIHMLATAEATHVTIKNGKGGEVVIKP